MKFDWRIEDGVLKAPGFIANYEVSLGDHGWHAEAKYPLPATPDNWPGLVIEGTLADGSGVAEHLDWCEKHDDMMRARISLDECLAKCPAQPPAAKPNPEKTPGEMSGKASKFPSTMDAAVWASRCTAWFGAFKVPDLAEWFDSALARGYEEGREAGASRTMTVSQHLAWKQTNAAPPSAQAPELPSVEERLAHLKGQSLDDMRDELKRLKRELAAMRPEPPSVEERLAALEERVKWSPDSRLVEDRLKELESRLTQLIASKCQALDLRINERLKKLEVKSCE